MIPNGILVIGSANIDFTIGVDHLPAHGETVSGGVFLQAFGGKGANQAVAACRAGGNVTFVTCVGTDSHGDAVLQAMQEEGINTAGTRRTGRVQTGVAMIQYDHHGNNTIAVAPGANVDLLPEHLTDTFGLMSTCGLLVLQNELAPETLAALLVEARRQKTHVLLNFAPATTTPLQSLLGANIGLVVNETEAAMLLGTAVTDVSSAATAADALRKRGFQFAIVTLGAQGCCVRTPTDAFHQPAMPVRAVDTTAAGDTFCGALAAALMAVVDWKDETMRQCVRFAAAAAALSTTTAGAQTSIPGRSRIEAALAAWRA